MKQQPTKQPMLKLKINNIFASIQGEGRRTGFPCIFIRLFGCNFNCSYCDTLYAKAPSKEFKKMAIKQIIKEIKKYDIKYICITGGEPLLQKKGIQQLIESLPSYLFEINTNGSQVIWQQENLRWVIDYKLPSSGEWNKFLWENMERMKEEDELVFVISNREDYILAKEVAKMMEQIKNIDCNFSPCWKEMSAKKLVKWILEDKLNVRLNLQIHKVIWSPTKRGV